MIGILGCYLLQTTVLPAFALAGVTPNLLLILTVSASYHKGSNQGMVTGFLSGLLLDICYGSVLGVNALMFLLIGYLCGYASKLYRREDTVLALMLVACGEMVYELLYYVFHYFFKEGITVGYFFAHIALPRGVYTVAVAVLLYKLFHLVHLTLCRLERTEEEQTE